MLDKPPMMPEKKPRNIVNFFSNFGSILLKLNPTKFIKAEKIIDILPKYLDSIQVKIVLGPASNHSKKIKVLAKKFSNSLEIIPQTKDLRNYIAKSNFGICSGGITSYEFAKLGVPFAIIDCSPRT